MMKINLLKATLLVEKTMPCGLKKLQVWLLTCFAFLAATLIGSGVGLIVFAFGIRSPVLAAIFSIVGFLVCGYLLVKLRGSIFVPVRAGHVRVMLKQMVSKEPLTHKKQLELYNNTVSDVFSSIEELADLERKVRHVLLAIYMQRFNLSRFALGNPYLKKIIESLTGILLAFIAEVILAVAIRKTSESPASACKNALILFTQELDSLSKSIWLLIAFTFTGWVFFIFVMLFPINWLTGMLPVSFGLWNMAFAMLFAWAFKAIIFESIAVAALIPLFFETIKNQQVDSNTMQQLTALSPAFAKLEKGL